MSFRGKETSNVLVLQKGGSTEEKLAQFDDCVRDMKRHSIDAEDLEGRIRRIYREEEPHA